MSLDSDGQLARLLWDVLPEALALSDPAGTVLMANAAYFTLYGYSRDEVIGQNFSIIFPEEHRAWAQSMYAETFRGPEDAPPVEAVVRRRDGSERIVEARIRFLHDGQGSRVAMLNLIRDITAQREAEAASRAAEIERDGLLAREQEARQHAEAAVQSRDQFFATISHDLLNPLSAISAQAQLLARWAHRGREGDAAAIAEMATSIQVTTEQLSNQVRELLDLAQTEAGVPPQLQRVRCDLVGLVRGVLHAFRETLQEHPVDLHFDEAPLVGEWDEQRLRRLFVNLLGNAAKYSGPGSAITISLSRDREASHPAALIEVQDQVVGITPEALPHVFDLFYRSVDAQGMASGSGIGLASARRTAELHGGSISVESEEGHGTTFSVRLPLGEPPRALCSSDHQKDAAAQAARTPPAD